MGVYVAPGETYAVENDGPEELRVLSVVAPEDRAEATGERKVTVRFADQPELDASAERTFRYLVNEDTGCFDVTQFVGIVQPSKAPFHSHSYDEVGYIVSGEGVAHVGGREFPASGGLLLPSAARRGALHREHRNGADAHPGRLPSLGKPGQSHVCGQQVGQNGVTSGGRPG